MVCRRSQDGRDDILFGLAVARHGSFENARYVYSNHFQMSQDDWDEGWGWHNPATNRALAKMFASSYLLERGIGAFPESTNPVWDKVSLAAALPLRDPICALRVKQPLALKTDDGRDVYREHSHALVTNTAGALIHYHEDLVNDGEAVTAQLVETNATTGAGPGPAIHRICAIADDPAPADSQEGWCYALAGRPLLAGVFDRSALLWVFGRDSNGEVIVYYNDWYADTPQWRSFSLSSVLTITDPGNDSGRAEVPCVLKHGTPAEQRLDIVVRSGFKLYHFWRSGSNVDVQNGWQAEDVTAVTSVDPNSAQIRTRPTMVPEPYGRGFHVFARNQNGAVMQYTHAFETTARCTNLPFPTTVPCTVPVSAFWLVRNVDNEIDGVAPTAAVAHTNVAGEIKAVTASNGAVHVIQRKTDTPRGLFHYTLESNVWRRGRWWGRYSESLEETAILPNDEPELRPEDFPFDVYVRSSNNALYRFQHIDNGSDDWLRDDISEDAVAVDTGVSSPSSVQGPIAASAAQFEEWIIRNTVCVTSPPALVRHVWVSRSGWVADARPTTGWKVEWIVLSEGSTGAPAINDFERVMDVFTFDAGNFVRHRLTRDRPWHSSIDYYNWASGKKHGYEYEPEDGDWPIAYASPWPAWNVNMKCPCFTYYTDDDGEVRNPLSPSARASTMLHEATHLNFRGWFKGWGHGEKNGSDADEWYSHGLWDIPPRGLSPGSHRHSMYQMEVEFLADLFEFPAPELPFDVWNGAANHAQHLMNVAIINVPPWSPGLPRPL